MKRLNVLIVETTGLKREFVSSHNTTDPTRAIDLAIKKAYGNKCSLFLNRGLTNGRSRLYGQIGHWTRDYAYSMDTGIVYIDVL